MVIITVLDNILETPPPEGEVETDEVGVGIVTSSENYGRFLLRNQETVDLGLRNIG